MWLLLAKSSIRIVASDEWGPTISRPTPSTCCSASRRCMRVASTRSLSGPSWNRSARRASRSTATYRNGSDTTAVTKTVWPVSRFISPRKPACPWRRISCARGVDDRDLALEDRDERVRAVADAIENLADAGGSLLPERAEPCQLRLREDGTGRNSHRHGAYSAAPLGWASSLSPDRRPPHDEALHLPFGHGHPTGGRWPRPRNRAGHESRRQRRTRLGACRTAPASSCWPSRSSL